MLKQNKPLLRTKMEDFVLSRHALVSINFPEGSEEPFVLWQKAAGREFREPFFYRTLARLRERAVRRIELRTGVEALLRRSSAKKQMLPNGLIFHISRCGSTLLSNMLYSVEDNFVLSEPFLATWAKLFSPKVWTSDRWVELTRASLAAHGGMAPFTAKRFFIKLAGSDIVTAPLIRQAAPGAQEIFLYRDPVEVVMSLIASPLQLPWLWNEDLIGLPHALAVERPLSELIARVVGRMLAAMCEHLQDNTLLLNYNQLGTSTPDLLMRHFGIPRTEKNLDRMLSCLDVDAKDVNKGKYIPDSHEKQASARSAVRDTVSAFAADSFLRLEKLRRERGSTRVEERPGL